MCSEGKECDLNGCMYDDLQSQLQEEMTDYATALKEHTAQLTAANDKLEKFRQTINHQCCPQCHGLLQLALADTEEK